MSIAIEMAQIQLHTGLDLLYTVHEAMAEHPDNQTDYSNALYGVYNFLKGVESEMAEAIMCEQKELPRCADTPTRAGRRQII